MTKKRLQTIRELIIKRRDELAWSNYKLAQESGLREHQISRWLNEGRADHQPTISTATLEPILRALNLKIKP